MKKTLLIIISLILPLSTLASADQSIVVTAGQAEPEQILAERSFSCTDHSVTRTVKIIYPSGTTLPCRVIYDKSQEGGELQILWQATTEEGYCEDKAETFVNKLQGWGWECSEGAG